MSRFRLSKRLVFFRYLSDLCCHPRMSIGAVGQIPSTLGDSKSSADGVEDVRAEKACGERRGYGDGC